MLGLLAGLARLGRGFFVLVEVDGLIVRTLYGSARFTNIARLAGLASFVGLTGFARLSVAATVAATTAATATATTPAILSVVFSARAALFLVDLVLLDEILLVDFGFVILDRGVEGLGAQGRDRARARTVDAHARAFEGRVDQHLDRHAVAGFDLGQFGALPVQDIDRGFGACSQADLLAATARGLFLDHPQRRQAGARCGPHQARAFAMRAGLGRSLEHAGAEPLAAHFHQAEVGDPPDLDPRPVVLERVLHRLLDLTDVAVLLHVDEVDDDQARHVAQPQLASNLGGSLDVGGKGGLLDIMLARRPAGVDVDRDQRLGRVDDDIAAALELHERLVHRAQLVLDAVALEQRGRLAVQLHPPDVAGHQQLHEAAGGAIAVLALDQHGLDVLVVKVADRALHQVAVAVDERRGRGPERILAHLVPQAGEIVEVALDLDPGPLETRGADDQPHGRGKLQVGDDRLQPLAVAAVADLPADPAAVRRVGHQHAVTPGEAEVGGQGRALVAALFLDDLDEQHLAALDDVLDLVAAAQVQALATNLVGSLVLAAAAPAARTMIFLVGIALAVEVLAFALGFLGHIVDPVILVMRIERLVFGLAAQSLFLGGMLRFLSQQRFAIGLGDLVIIGVDFAEGEEAVAVAAIVDERRLERRFDTGYLGEIDISLELLVLGGLEVKLLDPVSLDDGDPGLFQVARVDQHARGH